MPTIRQRKLARVIIENSLVDNPLNGGQMLAKVGYSKNLVKQPTRIIESEGVKEALNDYGFNVDAAKKVVAEILHKKNSLDKDKLKASEMIFKVHRVYGDGENSKVPTNQTNIFIQNMETKVNKFEEDLKKELGYVDEN